ncbi:hypothetical protein [Saccharopolyspora spinosa]|uniref:hypothetical protein n=1 Tax=Saccharopolyspora spinosa TaxID=60894 RepID=UPI0011798CFB|nr:hypothetical protein [Saccharopolyspora spinosa]
MTNSELLCAVSSTNNAAAVAPMYLASTKASLPSPHAVTNSLIRVPDRLGKRMLSYEVLQRKIHHVVGAHRSANPAMSYASSRSWLDDLMGSPPASVVELIGH